MHWHIFDGTPRLLVQIATLFKRIHPLTLLLWLGLILVSVALQWLGLVPEFRFDRSKIEAGQWFRLISANLVHLNAQHLLLNILGLGLVLVFFSDHLKTLQWLSLLLVSSLAVTGGVYGFNPEINRYVGLSGVLHGLFIVAAMVEIKRFPLSGWILLSVLVAKLAWEQLNGAMPGSESMINGHVVVDSHLYGALSGLCYGLVLTRRSWLRLL